MIWMQASFWARTSHRQITERKLRFESTIMTTEKNGYQEVSQVSVCSYADRFCSISEIKSLGLIKITCTILHFEKAFQTQRIFPSRAKSLLCCRSFVKPDITQWLLTNQKYQLATVYKKNQIKTIVFSSFRLQSLFGWNNIQTWNLMMTKLQKGDFRHRHTASRDDWDFLTRRCTLGWWLCFCGNATTAASSATTAAACCDAGAIPWQRSMTHESHMLSVVSQTSAHGHFKKKGEIVLLVGPRIQASVVAPQSEAFLLSTREKKFEISKWGKIWTFWLRVFTMWGQPSTQSWDAASSEWHTIHKATSRELSSGTNWHKRARSITIPCALRIWPQREFWRSMASHSPLRCWRPAQTTCATQRRSDVTRQRWNIYGNAEQSITGK